MKKQASVRTTHAATAQPARSAQAGHSKAAAPAATRLPASDALVASLLARDVTPARQQALVHGVVIATLLEMLPDGKVRIAVPSHGISDMHATPVCALAALREGGQIAVMFEQGDTTRALVIGPMAGGDVASTVADEGGNERREAVIDDERILIEAEHEIELRCGEAAIILTRDGRILLRGTYISSHASATQRIRGGAVQIN